MAYKKYIQKNGKLYGPYLYESKRVDGKVISEYHGQKKTFDSKKIKDFLFFFGLAIIIGFFIFFIFLDKGLTGNVVLSLDSTYEKGRPLDGVLQFTLKEGELIPSDTKVILENSGQTYEFQLNQILDDELSEGNYYVFGKTLEGNGQGYGLEGEKETYPEVEFTLQIYNEVGEESEENSSENSTESTLPITGQSVNSKNSFSRLFRTSMVSLDFEKEVIGKVSKDNSFIYELEEGQTAELKPKSVKSGNIQLEDNIISLNEESGKIIVTTEYSEIQKGFGENFSGNEQKIYSLDLSGLNLTFDEGVLNVKLVHSEEELVSLKTSLKNAEPAEAEVIIEEEPEPLAEEKTNETINDTEELISLKKELTTEEIGILSANFGNITLTTTKSEVFNGRIILGYLFDKYTAEFSYDSDLSESILKKQMENDRIKFLKDIANSVSENNLVSKPFENSNSSYTY